LAIQHIHTFLVHAGKNAKEAREIGGADLPLEGKLFQLLYNIYARSDQECDIDIAFRPSNEGVQQNPCRDLLVRHLTNPELRTAMSIAARLESMTDGRSGIGLLFVIVGLEGREHKVVISRFPTDTAILAEENRRALNVEFLERVFMKSATSYKAVAYRHASLVAGFWVGRAIDRQHSQNGISSNYWISDFLASDLATTPAAGSHRLAQTLKNAAKNAAPDIKREIIAAATLARNVRGQTTSISDFQDRFALSPLAREAIQKEIKKPRLAEERFALDLVEFNSVVGYRSVALSNGAMLTAQSADFDNVFDRQTVDEATETVRFSTAGRIIDEQLKNQP
jgi:hypothetical protein